MRFIIVGYTNHPSQNTVRIAESLKRQKHQVILLDFKQAATQRRNLNQLRADVMLVTMGRDFGQERKSGGWEWHHCYFNDVDCLKVNWIPDEYSVTEPLGHWIGAATGVYDLLLVETAGLIEDMKYTAGEVLWTPQFFDDHYHKPLPRNPQFDIGFLGGVNLEQSTVRRLFLRNLIVDGYQLEWWGNGSKPMVVGPQMADFYSKAKLTVNFVNDKISQKNKLQTVGSVHWDSPHTAEFEQYELAMSNRVFKAMGSGCPVITHRIPGMERLGLIDGENIITYEPTDYNDFKSKVDYYLEHDEEREQIARNGQTHILNNYTIDGVVADWVRLFGEQL